ncbi:MAG: hypothetical protein JSS81_07775 [Acidobacteria bacterium]|nr:hypothetical protein [Acidobacteriota bacterium]
MFIGHFAVGLASKRLAPGTNLGWLVAAPLLLDLIWPVLLLANVEKVVIEPGNTAFTPLDFTYYPYTHSLVGAACWALVFGLVYFALKRDRTGALAIGAGVLSHWLLDAVVHRPDLPLYPGGTTLIGFGLWNSIPGTLVVEGLLFLAGAWLYLKATRPLDRAGTLGCWSFIVFLVLIYIGNALGPPPPGVTPLAAVALLVLIFPLWAGWFDRHRTPR